MTRRDHIALTVVVGLAALLAYWFLLLAPKREEASTLKEKVTQERTRLQTAQADLAASQAARASYAANYTAVAQLGKAVPADDDVPSLVYQLDSTAGASGVDFQTIKLASGAASAPPPPAPPAGKGGEAASASSTSPGGSSAAASSSPPAGTASAPAAPTQAATAPLPPGAIVGPAGIATMPFDFSFNGSFFRLSNFFGRVQRYVDATRAGIDTTGRLLTINSIAITFTAKGYPHLKATVSANAYLLPASEGLLNGARPSAPPQGGAQPVSNQGAAPPVAPATAAAP